MASRLKPTKTIWVAKDGQRVRVKDMGDTHLVNTIRLLRRHATRLIDENLSAAYSIEGYLQGEMAQVAIAQDIDILEESDPEELLADSVPCYETMLDEAERRGLTL